MPEPGAPEKAEHGRDIDDGAGRGYELRTRGHANAHGANQIHVDHLSEDVYVNSSSRRMMPAAFTTTCNCERLPIILSTALYR